MYEFFLCWVEKCLKIFGSGLFFIKKENKTLGLPTTKIRNNICPTLLATNFKYLYFYSTILKKSQLRDYKRLVCRSPYIINIVAAQKFYNFRWSIVFQTWPNAITIWDVSISDIQLFWRFYTSFIWKILVLVHMANLPPSRTKYMTLATCQTINCRV